MTELSALLNADKRPTVVTDLAQVAEETVSAQSGITGMTLKGSVAAAKKVDSNVVEKAVNRLLPDLLGELQPHWKAFKDQGEGSFGAYLALHEKEVIDSILRVADRNVEKAPGALVKIYNSLRGKAANIISPALAGFGETIEKHMS